MEPFRSFILLSTVTSIFGIPLSCDEIQEVIDGHNERRLEIAQGIVEGQPAACGMHVMIWDEELAEKAEEWASYQVFKHNPDKTVDSRRFNVGENIYLSRSSNKQSKLNITKSLDMWFSEHKHYDFEPLTKKHFTGKHPIGHYTQMVWSKSIYVGCGVSEYFDNGWKANLLICNYGPTGNYLGQVPYKTGNNCGKLICEVDDCSALYGYQCDSLDDLILDSTTISA